MVFRGVFQMVRSSVTVFRYFANGNRWPEVAQSLCGWITSIIFPKGFAVWRALCGHGQRGQVEMVSDEGQRFAGFRVHVSDAPEPFGVVYFALGTLEPYKLVAPKTICTISLVAHGNVKAHVAFGPQNKKGVAAVDAVKAFEIDVSAIHP